MICSVSRFFFSGPAGVVYNVDFLETISKSQVYNLLSIWINELYLTKIQVIGSRKASHKKGGNPLIYDS
jgi:hypothetical protein